MPPPLLSNRKTFSRLFKILPLMTPACFLLSTAFCFAPDYLPLQNPNPPAYLLRVSSTCAAKIVTDECKNLEYWLFLIAATKNMTTPTNMSLKLELKSISSLDCNRSDELFVPFKHGSTISALFQDTWLSANLKSCRIVNPCVKQPEPSTYIF